MHGIILAANRKPWEFAQVSSRRDLTLPYAHGAVSAVDAPQAAHNTAPKAVHARCVTAGCFDKDAVVVTTRATPPSLPPTITPRPSAEGERQDTACGRVDENTLCRVCARLTVHVPSASRNLRDPGWLIEEKSEKKNLTKPDALNAMPANPPVVAPSDKKLGGTRNGPRQGRDRRLVLSRAKQLRLKKNKNCKPCCNHHTGAGLCTVTCSSESP